MNTILSRNDEHKGLELSFSEKPSRDLLDKVKEQGFRWHNAKKVWFAKETPERVKFALDIGAEASFDSADIQKVEQRAPAKRNESKAVDKLPNTFAAHYDAIGDAKILKASEVRLLDEQAAYLEDIKCYYRRPYSGDSITLTDLQHAGRVGKTCKSWTIYPVSYGDNVLLQLVNEEKIQTCKDLFEAITSGREFETVRVREREEKAVDVFSPFEEMKPLKELPSKWTKRNFAQAVLSGQIFRGEVAYRYTDDYAMDAAYNFSEGVPLHMPSFAKCVLEDWSSLTSVRTHSGEPCRDGSYSISYSEYSNSGKTLWFDVNCDIAEGKRRAEERQAGLERYNRMMEASCITVTSDQIDPNKLYVLQQLEQNGNTGKYGSKTENVPGHLLRGRLEEGYVHDVLSVKELKIQPDRIYEVSNFFHRPGQELLSDERVIDCGNWKCIVTGLALQELITEQKYMPHISPDAHEYGPTFREAEARLQQFAKGSVSYLVGNATNYADSLSRPRSEHERCCAETRNPTLDSLIGSAKARAGVRNDTEEKEKIVSFQR